MAHPLAGVAAMSAFGVGFASHAFGVWFGAMTAATDRVAAHVPADVRRGSDGRRRFRDPPKKPSITAKSGPETVGARQAEGRKAWQGGKAPSDDEAAETASSHPEELVTEKPQPEPKADAPTGAHLQELLQPRSLPPLTRRKLVKRAEQSSNSTLKHCCRFGSKDVPAAPSRKRRQRPWRSPLSRLRRRPPKQLRNGSSKNRFR